MLRLSLLFLLALPAIRAGFECSRNMTNVNGYCVGVVPSLLTYDQAESYCNSTFGAKLATVNGQARNLAIAKVATSADTVFLGYKCNSTTHCTGNDGSVIQTSQYFYGGKANPAVGQCVLMLGGDGGVAGQWLSHDCNQTSAFVCGTAGPTENQTITAMKTSKCGMPYKLQVPVNITSLNYPYNYDNDENCSYFIYSNGQQLTFHFDDFYTGSSHYVVIYTSSSANFYSLSRSTYTSGYQGSFSTTVYSGYAMITFVTDSGTTYRGFSARITN